MPTPARAEEAGAFIAARLKLALAYDTTLESRPPVVRIAILTDRRRPNPHYEAEDLHAALEAALATGLGPQRRTAISFVAEIGGDPARAHDALCATRDVLAAVIPPGVTADERAQLGAWASACKVRLVAYPARSFTPPIAVGIAPPGRTDKLYLDEEWLLRTGGPFDPGALDNNPARRVAPGQRNGLAESGALGDLQGPGGPGANRNPAQGPAPHGAEGGGR